MNEPKTRRCLMCGRPGLEADAMFCSYECYERDLRRVLDPETGESVPLIPPRPKLSGTYQFYLHCRDSLVAGCAGGVQGMDRDTPADAVADAIDQARFRGWTVTADKALCPACALAESVVGAMTGGAR